MVTDHYIFALWFLSFFFFSSPNLSGRRLDTYHTSTHGVALVQMKNAGLKRAASLTIQDPKKSQKIAIWAPSHKFVELYLRNYGTYRQSEKIVKQQYLLHMFAQYGELRPTSGWDRFVSLGTPANFNGFRVLAALLHGTLVVDVSQTLRRWTEGATYIRQGGHDVGKWLTFLVMAALWNRAGHYIFMLWFLSIYLSSSIFFSSPNLSGRRLDVYHTSTHGVALVRI